MKAIDLENPAWYCGQHDERTRDRLCEISVLGLQEGGIAQFGIPEVVSGLFIEHLWNMSILEWNEYMAFVKDRIGEVKQ